MAIANASLQASVTAMALLTTTAAKTTALLTDLKSLVLTEADSRGSDNYDQARKKMVVLFDDALTNSAEIATGLDANI